MRANPALDMEPVGFVDDANAKVGAQICGLPVLGRCSQIPQLVTAHDIQRIVITMPSTPYPRQQEIIALCEETGVATHALPGVYEILAGHKTVDQLPRVDINLLLHRTTVETDQVQVAARLKGMRVLVTGAGGSIGGELCRQIARFKPEQILLLGHGENSIFEIGLDLRLSFPNLATRPVIADVRDAERIDWVVQHYRPDIIFHAAAHKHVPFMEGCVHEAIANNVLGTRNVVHAAERYAVERLIMISTDKAVNPASVMGASKRLAELFVLSAACRSGRAYMAVRFGNVLGSRGSVVPVFQRQIAAGGPVTVTHPQMRRYFMTIPEAVQLVLQASHLGQGGEIFVLDMGQQVRIVDLANDLIKLSGLVPGRDIRVIYTGVRPGEKLFEELFLEQEEYERTRHARIFVARSESQVSTDLLEPLVVELVGLSKRMQSQGDADLMRVLLPQVCRYIDGSWRRPAPVVAGPVTRLESPQPEAVITRPALSST
jgi:FlaA1/EpsC-like NDP-sugar epimerase